MTAGPTHEPIDPVRFIGNRSSGKMGVAIAAEALGARRPRPPVLGPGTVDAADRRRDSSASRPPRRCAPPCSIRSMAADAVVMAAAVADFRPKDAAEAKLKKESGLPDLVLEPTPDILAELGERDRDARPVLVGFAAETSDVEAAGREKLAPQASRPAGRQRGGPRGHRVRRRHEHRGDPGRRRERRARCATGPSASSPGRSWIGSSGSSAPLTGR